MRSGKHQLQQMQPKHLSATERIFRNRSKAQRLGWKFINKIDNLNKLSH